jgi:osmotically-inducible protein OsmY
MAPPVMTDEVLADHVRGQLARDSRIDASAVQVRVSGGIAYLTGEIPSTYEKGIVHQDAKDTVGVGWVTDELRVGAAKRSSASIAADVLWELETDSALTGTKLKAQVADGTVTLAGKLHSQYQKNHAREVAYRVPGVRLVVNDIEVVGGKRPDKDVADAVRSGLERNWRTCWVKDSVQVEVKEGSVTLSGNVDRWAEREAAARVAYDTPGVWRVFNQIHVTGYPYLWENQDDQPVTIWEFHS